jgi:hypothetical protein
MSIRARHGRCKWRLAIPSLRDWIGLPEILEDQVRAEEMALPVIEDWNLKGRVVRSDLLNGPNRVIDV